MHLTSTETEMMAGWDIVKNDPRVAVGQALDALASGALEYLDAKNRDVKRQLGSAQKDLCSPFGISRSIPENH